MGHAYQGAIEDTLELQMGLPKGTIKNMNTEIGKLRQTGDFLEQINGDKPASQPSKTTKGKLLGHAVRLGAGIAGEAITGGLGGGAVGYLLSRPLADALTQYITRLPMLS